VSVAARSAALAAGLMLVGGLGTAQAATPAPVASATLQGSFSLAGRITVAKNIPGERRGATVKRTWTFSPGCASGPCPTVGLLRNRASGIDRVTLAQVGPGVYVGNGVFDAPLRCGRRTYRPGERAPFTIRVHITAANVAGSGVVATRIDATYVNPSRTNLTPCVAFLGHDSARYHGYLAAG